MKKDLIKIYEQHIPKHSKYTKSNIIQFLLRGDSSTFKEMKQLKGKTKQNKMENNICQLLFFIDLINILKCLAKEEMTVARVIG